MPRSGYAFNDLRPDVIIARYQHIDHTWCFDGVYDVVWTVYVNSRSGASIIPETGGPIPLRPGHAWLMPPWCPLDLRCEGRVGHLWVRFALDALLPDVVRELVPLPISLPLRGLLAAEVSCLRHHLRQVGEDHPSTVLSAAALASSVFGQVTASFAADQLDRLRRRLDDGHPLAPALEQMERRLDQPLYNDGLARTCGLSKDHFIRIFRRHFGQSPAQYLITRRLEQVCRLLSSGDEPIEHIARVCGLNDRFYLGRLFRRRLGVTPAAYRRRMRAAADR